jgi:membrane protein YqaA with SNARE-associated domain
MPEAVLVPLAAARPGQWLRLAVAAMLGSTTGAALSYAVWGVGRPRTLVDHLPLVRPAMVGAARAWLASEGAAGVRHQPISGVPIKVFAFVAASSGVPLPAFLVCAAAARGARFVVVCAAAALGGRLLRRRIQGRPGLFLTAWSATFAVGLRRTVVSWERRAAPPP